MISRIIILLLFLSALVLTAPAQNSESTISLPDLIAEMLRSNPELQAYHSQWEAAQARIPQAGALPDPVLGLGVMSLPVDNFSFTREPMTGKQISLMQMFPFPGKQGIRQKIARNEAEVARQNYLNQYNRLVRDVKTTYFDLFFNQKARETNDQNTALTHQFEQIAETRYRVGQGLQQDVLKAQLQRFKLSDDLLQLEQQRESLEARLNSLLNRPVNTPVGKTGEIEITDFSLSFEDLTTLAEQHSPLLNTSREMVTQGSNRVSIARKEYLPDFSLELSYTQREALQNGDEGMDFLSGMVNITLPLYFWKKQRQQVSEYRLNEQAFRQMDNGIRAALYADLESIYADLQKSRRRLILFQSGIIPQASQALQSALSAYRVDKVEFLTLIDSQTTLLEYHLEYFRILSDYHKSLAELDFLLGIELSRVDQEK